MIAKSEVNSTESCKRESQPADCLTKGTTSVMKLFKLYSRLLK